MIKVPKIMNQIISIKNINYNWNEVAESKNISIKLWILLFIILIGFVIKSIFDSQTTQLIIMKENYYDSSYSCIYSNDVQNRLKNQMVTKMGIGSMKTIYMIITNQLGIMSWSIPQIIADNNNFMINEIKCNLYFALNTTHMSISYLNFIYVPEGSIINIINSYSFRRSTFLTYTLSNLNNGSNVFIASNQQLQYKINSFDLDYITTLNLEQTFYTTIIQARVNCFLPSNSPPISVSFLLSDNEIINDKMWHAEAQCISEQEKSVYDSLITNTGVFLSIYGVLSGFIKYKHKLKLLFSETNDSDK